MARALSRLSSTLRSERPLRQFSASFGFGLSSDTPNGKASLRSPTSWNRVSKSVNICCAVSFGDAGRPYSLPDPAGSAAIAPTAAVQPSTISPAIVFRLRATAVP